jgi:endoplasmic reticulum-Golgi intermediate compartment protein 3
MSALISFVLTEKRANRAPQDISPMKVINREARAKSFTGFLVGVCAVIGGTLTVAAAVDRALYEGVQRVRKAHNN